ncbi:hypothetical protein HPB47_026094 [Ixodes persulcatus]|uniref:Uncharacterized protein n=1 Tax=Ixodes persulcatus TaxID=34615 RepID=A0AC60Q1P4_IXOPE|nr:hypothetical protein HPB47_026094 [Ixodes persulcatus]
MNRTLYEYSYSNTCDSVVTETVLKTGTYNNARWSALLNQRLALGCAFPWCTERHTNVVLEALSFLGINYTVTLMIKGRWMQDLEEEKIDIVVDNVILSEYRWRHVYFPLPLNYGTMVFYTSRRFYSHTDKILRTIRPTYFALVYVSLAASMLFFCLVNYRYGRRLFKDLHDVALALISTLMLFSYPVPKPFLRNQGGRIVLFCWMAGGFSLAAYFQSLLISSLTTGPSWEADNTLHKLYSRLASGTLLPCVRRGSYLDDLLCHTNASQGILGALALAWRRSPDRNSSWVGKEEECVDRVVRGTHVFVTGRMDPCVRTTFKKVMELGKEQIQTVYGGTATKKKFHLRHSYSRLVERLFETGLSARVVQIHYWNCSRSEAEPSVANFDAAPFLYVYCYCCGAACLMLKDFGDLAAGRMPLYLVLKLLGYKLDRKMGDIRARFREDHRPANTGASPWSSTTGFWTPHVAGNSVGSSAS